MVASRNEGIESLRQCLDDLLEVPALPQAKVVYPSLIEEALTALTPAVAASHPTARDRWTALKLLEYDDATAPNVSPEILKQVSEHRHRIHQVLGEDIDIAVADSRYGYAHRLVTDVATRPREVSLTTSDKIDQIVLNRWLGIPIFLAVMYLLFMFAINVGGAFIDFFDIVFGTIFVDGLGALLSAMGMPDLVTVVFADGMGGGIQTVATFIPVIGCLFLFMAFFEDSGYMARAAFVMDRFMRFVGRLPGKSFVPMWWALAVMCPPSWQRGRWKVVAIASSRF